MKDSGIEWIGEIPEDWDYIKLKYLYTFEKGKNASIYTQEYIGKHLGEYPVYSGQTENDGIMGKINSYDYNVTECLFTTTVGAKVMTPKILNGKFSLSQNCLIMHNVSECNNKYCYYLLLSLFAYEKSLIPTYMQPSLRIEDLNKYSFFIPSSSEQQKIADFLDEKVSEIDKVIEKTKESIEEYKKYKQTIITETVTKGLNTDVEMKDSGIEWIGEIPKGWETIKIKYTSWLKGRIGWQGLKSNEYQEEGPYLITGTDFSNGIINWDSCVHISDERFNEAPDIHINENDLLITKDGTIGKIAIAKNCPQKVSLNSGVLLIRNTKKIRYYDKYLYFVLLSNQFWTWYEMSQTGNSTIKHLYQEQFYNFEFTFPKIEEQKQIADFLDEKCNKIDELITKKEKIIEELDTYKKSLIYEYVTGKREVE